MKLPIPARLIGYARVSTEEQTTEAQEAELKAAGCDVVICEQASGSLRSRPALAALLQQLHAGDTLVVVRLDRLARSVSHLLDVIENLKKSSAHFRSLRDPIDTTTPQGMFSLQVLGAVAQLERSLISERTKAGIKAAIARGKKPGNPGIRAGKAEALAKLRLAQKAAYGDKVLASAERWVATVRRLRPEHSWLDIARLLTSKGFDITPERLRRAVKWLVSEGMLDRGVLARSIPRSSEDRLVSLIAGIHLANPDLTLRDIADNLEQLHERTPRGSTKWSPSSVKNLLDRSRRSSTFQAKSRSNQSR